MEMSKASKPELIDRFELMLWANTPKHWILKTTFFHNTLFVSILISTQDPDKFQKIRRSFGLQVINNRVNDIWGLASDCVDEMKTEET
jgi:hypothetical protein